MQQVINDQLIILSSTDMAKCYDSIHPDLTAYSLSKIIPRSCALFKFILHCFRHRQYTLQIGNVCSLIQNAQRGVPHGRHLSCLVPNMILDHVVKSLERKKLRLKTAMGRICTTAYVDDMCSMAKSVPQCVQQYAHIKEFMDAF